MYDLNKSRKVFTTVLDEQLKSVIVKIARTMSFASKYWIVKSLERLCCLTHPFHVIEIALTGRHCNVTLLAFALDEEWGTGFWRAAENDTK